jgi:hypothetical protein
MKILLKTLFRELVLAFRYLPVTLKNVLKAAWAYIQRRDSIMAWSVILSVYGADPIAEVKLFSILHFLISCRLVFNRFRIE